MVSSFKNEDGAKIVYDMTVSYTHLAQGQWHSDFYHQRDQRGVF